MNTVEIMGCTYQSLGEVTVTNTQGRQQTYDLLLELLYGTPVAGFVRLHPRIVHPTVLPAAAVLMQPDCTLKAQGAGSYKLTLDILVSMLLHRRRTLHFRDERIKEAINNVIHPLFAADVVDRTFFVQSLGRHSLATLRALPTLPKLLKPTQPFWIAWQHPKHTEQMLGVLGAKLYEAYTPAALAS